MINVGYELTLDNKKIYIVSGKVIYKGKDYFMLNEKDNIKNMMFCVRDEKKLTKIEDPELVSLLLPLLLKSLDDEIKNGEN